MGWFCWLRSDRWSMVMIGILWDGFVGWDLIDDLWWCLWFYGMVLLVEIWQMIYGDDWDFMGWFCWLRSDRWSMVMIGILWDGFVGWDLIDDLWWWLGFYGMVLLVEIWKMIYGDDWDFMGWFCWLRSDRWSVVMIGILWDGFVGWDLIDDLWWWLGFYGMVLLVEIW